MAGGQIWSCCVFLWLQERREKLLLKSLQSRPTLCDLIDGSSPGYLSLGFSSKNTGVGCHFLLQCVKVKSESEVTQSCPTLSDPMDCSLPGSSIHGVFQARVLEWGAIAFSGREKGEGQIRSITLKYTYYCMQNR